MRWRISGVESCAERERRWSGFQCPALLQQHCGLQVSVPEAQSERRVPFVITRIRVRSGGQQDSGCFRLLIHQRDDQGSCVSGSSASVNLRSVPEQKDDRFDWSTIGKFLNSSLQGNPGWLLWMSCVRICAAGKQGGNPRQIVLFNGLEERSGHSRLSIDGSPVYPLQHVAFTFSVDNLFMCSHNRADEVTKRVGWPGLAK